MKWDIADSFVTHMKSLENLRQIKERGIEDFIKQQKERVEILSKLIKEHDDRKSKSYYCLAAALMEVEDLKKAIAESKNNQDSSIDKKQLAKQTKAVVAQLAKMKGIELVYRKEKV